VNEAALLARDDKRVVAWDFESAIDRLIAGSRRSA
jgi:ATP-dependent Zn protease